MVLCAMNKTKALALQLFRQSSVNSAVHKSMLWHYGLQNVQQLPGSSILHQNGDAVHI